MPQPAGFGFRTRFELYTVGDNVVAASLVGLVGPAGEMPLEPSILFFVENGAAGTLELQDHSHNSILGGFRCISEVGGAGAAALTLGMTTVNGCGYEQVEKRKMN